MYGLRFGGEALKTIVLVGCSASKLAVPAGRAADMYTGELFKLQSRWASACLGGIDGWYILSAKYGLIAPGTAIDAYEETLDTAEKRRVWETRIFAQFTSGISNGNTLLHLPGIDCPTRFLIFAGENYRGWISRMGKLSNWRWEVPLQGLGIGEQKAALGRMLDSLQRDKETWPAVPLQERVERSLAQIGGAK